MRALFNMFGGSGEVLPNPHYAPSSPAPRSPKEGGFMTEAVEPFLERRSNLGNVLVRSTGATSVGSDVVPHASVQRGSGRYEPVNTGVPADDKSCLARLFDYYAPWKRSFWSKVSDIIPRGYFVIAALLQIAMNLREFRPETRSVGETFTGPVWTFANMCAAPEIFMSAFQPNTLGVIRALRLLSAFMDGLLLPAVAFASAAGYDVTNLVSKEQLQHTILAVAMEFPGGVEELINIGLELTKSCSGDFSRRDFGLTVCAFFEWTLAAVGFQPYMKIGAFGHSLQQWISNGGIGLSMLIKTVGFGKLWGVGKRARNVVHPVTDDNRV